MAPPKTDKESEKEAQQLKKLLSLARKGPINFGISLGKPKPEDLAFLAHKTKNPKSLRKKAREETGNSKGAHGEMTVDGKNLVFACEDNPPGPIVKAMRIFLRELKVPLRPEFIGPDGAAVPDEAAPADGEDADDARGAEAAPADGADGASADGAPADGAEAEKPGRKDEAIMQLRAAFKKLVAKAKDAIAAHPEVREGLLATLKEISENLQAGEPQAARAGIIEAGALLKSLAGREATAPSEGPSLAELGRMGLEWRKAKQDVEKRLAGLQRALEAENEPECTQAARKLDQVLERFSEGLADTFDAMISASDPDRRDALRRQAAQVSASYLQYVVNDPLVAHMDKHPIEKLEVAKTLTPPLQAIATRLKHLAA